MVEYRHSQTGALPLAFGALAFLVLLFVVGRLGAQPIAVAVVGFFVFWLAQFWRLTVSVTEERIRIAFGIGLIHKTIPTAAVRRVCRVRNPWYYGWGIRLYPQGWLFNIAGLDAVELLLEDGRAYRIGSDEPDALRAAIAAAAGIDRPSDDPAGNARGRSR